MKRYPKSLYQLTDLSQVGLHWVPYSVSGFSAPYLTVCSQNLQGRGVLGF